MISTNVLLATLRAATEAYRYDTDEDAAERMADAFELLDAHLSAGGTPPEEWREGPDAPTGHKDAIIRAADILGMDPAELTARLLDDDAPAPGSDRAIADRLMARMYPGTD